MSLASVFLIFLATSPQLEEGRALVRKLDFAAARTQLEAARASTTLSLEERREVSGLLAHCFAAEGQLPEAERVYAELLATDARAPAPVSGPPRLRDAFRRAKERLFPPTFASLTREPAPPGRVGVQLLDPWNRCEGSVLIQRRVGSEAFATAPMPLDDTGRGQIELDKVTAWFIEARGADGTVCASLGSAQEPFVISSVPEAAVAVVPRVDVTPRTRALPWAVLGLTAATAVVAGVFTGIGVNSLERSKQLTFASDIRAAELASRDQLSLAWGFGGGTALAALATLVLFVAW